ncbi:MAG: type II toxin-antitoxin system VapC family toxin [Myxococcales bacterium]|nr:type II toxin-antitoxin system VapC family toxin [Myxococcales bacterium]
MIYLDTSALVKLVVREAETVALQTWIRLRAGETFFSSQLARVELVRAVKRAAPDHLDRARGVLAAVALLKIDDRILETAENLPPDVLRSLDAIHLATAFTHLSDVSAFVTYDVRLDEAARSLRIPVESPCSQER